MRTWGQSKISSYCFYIWCDSRELGGRCVHSGEELLRQGHIQNSVKHQRRSSFAKTAKGLVTLTVSTKKLGAEGDCNCMELVAAGWCARIWFRFDQIIRNLTSGDLEISLVVLQLGVNGLKKTRSFISQTCLREEGRRSSGIQCVERLQIIGLMLVYADVLFTCGECGFNYLGSWSFSKECAWNLGTKSMLHCFRKEKCQLSDTLEI